MALNKNFDIDDVTQKIKDLYIKKDRDSSKESKESKASKEILAAIDNLRQSCNEVLSQQISNVKEVDAKMTKLEVLEKLRDTPDRLECQQKLKDLLQLSPVKLQFPDVSSRDDTNPEGDFESPTKTNQGNLKDTYVFRNTPVRLQHLKNESKVEIGNSNVDVNYEAGADLGSPLQVNQNKLDEAYFFRNTPVKHRHLKSESKDDSVNSGFDVHIPNSIVENSHFETNTENSNSKTESPIKKNQANLRDAYNFRNTPTRHSNIQNLQFGPLNLDHFKKDEMLQKTKSFSSTEKYVRAPFSESSRNILDKKQSQNDEQEKQLQKNFNTLKENNFAQMTN